MTTTTSICHKRHDVNDDHYNTHARTHLSFVLCPPESTMKCEQCAKCAVEVKIYSSPQFYHTIFLFLEQRSYMLMALIIKLWLLGTLLQPSHLGCGACSECH